MVELESMQHFDETEVESSIPTGNLSSSPSSPHNSSQHTLSSLGSESDLSDVEIMDEHQCQSFATKMQQNLTKFLEFLKSKAQPARHNPAPRTKHARAQKFEKKRKHFVRLDFVTSVNTSSKDGLYHLSQLFPFHHLQNLKPQRLQGK
ncbi:hypothetical protein M422DRAFT_245458 [Sphaerobolus stellatus SS14]|nr:hypothetical protein M422DRAFT_245458 [Sphaerobolus stellatus SS14]